MQDQEASSETVKRLLLSEKEVDKLRLELSNA